MEVGKRYLVFRHRSSTDSDIEELICLEIAQVATKVQRLVEKPNSIWSGDTNKPFWILNDEIDTLGKKKYQIIEELVNI